MNCPYCDRKLYGDICTTHGIVGKKVTVNQSAGPRLHLPFIVSTNAGTAWTDMPVADTFLFGVYSHVKQADLTPFTQVRLNVLIGGTAPVANAKLRVGFASAFSGTVANYASIARTGLCSVTLAASAAQAATSGWVPMAGTARGEVFLALIGSDGNATADPVFCQASVEFK